MQSNEGMYYQASEDGSGSQRSSSGRILKIGAALIGGAGLVLLSMVGISRFQNTSADETTNLIGMPTSFRASASPMKGMSTSALAASLPGNTPWKELALLSIEAANTCGGPRDVSARANGKLLQAMNNLDPKDKKVLFNFGTKVAKKAQQIRRQPTADADVLPYDALGIPGALPPFKGLWDPLGFSAKATGQELAFYREAELKHGRVCMVATLGELTQESFHPFFNTQNLDYPFIQSFGQIDVVPFWFAIFAAIAPIEFAKGIERIDFSADPSASSGGLSGLLKVGLEPGDLGYDPLNIKPTDPVELEKMQNRELLHGRLAMIGAAGLIAQETLTQAKVFEGGIYGVPGDLPL